MPVAFDILHLTEIDSTQDEAVRQLQAGTNPGLVVIADHQTKGRGRQGRAWDSPIGNLSATVTVPLTQHDITGDYAFIAAVALYDAAAATINNSDALKLKWPNDLMLNGVKCAGLLLEAPLPHVLLIGLGVNIAHAPPDRAKLADAGATVSPRELLDRYLLALSQYIDLYRNQGLPPILSVWLSRAGGIGEPITARLPHATKTGIFLGLAADGALRLQLPDGTTETIHAGDVFFGGLTSP